MSNKDKSYHGKITSSSAMFVPAVFASANTGSSKSKGKSTANKSNKKTCK